MQYSLTLVLLGALGRAGALRLGAAGVRTTVAPVRIAAPLATATAPVEPVAHASSGDGKSKKIFVLGGDGFCGWPVALHLSDIGHEVRE
eukprot:scaffold79113_cov33-Tisochrysis_lutea.AAC.1